MMDPATKFFMDYAAAFEQTYVDDDWTRLTPFFSEDATYEVRGGPLACRLSGRDAILAGLKKSIRLRSIAPAPNPCKSRMVCLSITL